MQSRAEAGTTPLPRLARRVAFEDMADSERITPPWWLKPMNKVFMGVMQVGLIKDGPMVLTVPGRKSGKPRSTPITPFTVDRKRYVVGGFPDTDWVHAFPTLVPTGLSFMKNAGPVSEGRPDEFEALAGRCAVFRFDPVS
jgi:hypothetical protein